VIHPVGAPEASRGGVRWRGAAPEPRIVVDIARFSAVRWPRGNPEASLGVDIARFAILRARRAGAEAPIVIDIPPIVTTEPTFQANDRRYSRDKPTATKPKATTLAELRALIDTLPTFDASRTFVVASRTYSLAQAIQLVEGVLAVETGVAQAKAALREAVLLRKSVLARDQAAVAGLRGLLALSYSNSPVALATLKVAPRKPPAKLNIEAQRTKDAKARATRIARGTKSKKQKSKIFGNVTGVEITPVKKEP
jgi:hypothetical protein